MVQRSTVLCALVSLVFACAACVGGMLTQGGEAGLLGAELVLCDALTGAFFPPAAVACPGASGLLKAALDHVTVPAAPAGSSVPAASSAKSEAVAIASAGQALVVKKARGKATHPLILTSQGYALWHRRKHLGFGTKEQAEAINCEGTAAYLDTIAAAPEVFRPEVVAAPWVQP